jgi:NTE family protein
MLVLGGGGVRGLAHVGVLKVLERAGIEIDGIIGTSAGAIVGALYATKPDAARLERRVLTFLESHAFRRMNFRFDIESTRKAGGETRSLFDRLVHGLKKQVAMELLFRRQSMFRGELLHRLVGALVEGGRLEDCRIPLYVTALDLVHGREVILDRGDLVAAVAASSAVPGFFPPVSIDGALLSDAGLVNNMPIAAARRLGAECVVAVNLNGQIERIENFPTGIEVIFRSEEIGTKVVNDHLKTSADVLLEPNLNGRYWLDFENCSAVVDAGERAAQDGLAALEVALRRRKLVLFGGNGASHPTS